MSLLPHSCRTCFPDQIRAALAAGIEGRIKRYWKVSRQFSWRKTQRDCSTAHLSEKISSAGVIPQESQCRSFTKRMEVKMAYLIKQSEACFENGWRCITMISPSQGRTWHLKNSSSVCRLHLYNEVVVLHDVAWQEWLLDFKGEVWELVVNRESKWLWQSVTRVNIIPPHPTQHI